MARRLLSPLVVNNLLYDPGTGKVFSADGSQGCGYNPKYSWLGAAIPVCEALWTNFASGGSSFSDGGTPTVVTATAGSYNGDPILYLAAPSSGASGGLIRVFAYDANGNNNCGPYASLKFCTPLWTDQVPGKSPEGAGAVSVANGYAYVGGTTFGGAGNALRLRPKRRDQLRFGDLLAGVPDQRGSGLPRAHKSGGERKHGLRDRQRRIACLPSVEPDVARRAAQELFGTPGTNLRGRW